MPASLAYDSLIADMAGETPAVDFVSGFFKLMLVDGYSPNQGIDATRANISDETTGTGYVSGGLPCTLVTDEDPTTHVFSILMQNVLWTGANTFTATGGVVYQSYGAGAAGDPLVCYIDFGGAIECVAGTFTVGVTAPLQFQNTAS